MASIKVTPNRAGIKELLHDPGVAAELRRLAENVAAAAGVDTSVEVVQSAGYRSVARVADERPGALAREARDGRLVRALDAAG